MAPDPDPTSSDTAPVARAPEPARAGGRGAALRPPLAAVLWPILRPFRRRIQRTRDGERLRPGITAVVAARNEEFTIGFCLRSLLGFADQIVCIDNGSSDGTLRQMRAFEAEHSDDVEVEVVAMPGALLGDCREEGLRRTRREWHLRWDADMVARTTGSDSMRLLREQALADARPRTIQLPRTTLYADFWHTQRLGPVVDPGEPILMRFSRGIEYREFGRFDAVRVPLHYAQRSEPGRHYLHLAGLKADENLMHRFHYFEWREAVNRQGPALEPELQTLEGFTRRRNLDLFGTTDPRSLKFRYQRQLCYHLAPYDTERYGDYPQVLEEAMSGQQRFEVVYRDGRPWIRIDHQDSEMAGYEPTDEDLAWDPEAFLRRFLTPEECETLGIPPVL